MRTLLDFENAVLDLFEGLDFYRMGNYLGALVSFNRGLSLNQNDAALLNNRRPTKMGDHDALTYFNRAIAINWTDSNAIHNKALALRSWGNLTGAILSYKQTLLFDPRDKNTLNAIAHILGNHQIGHFYFHDKDHVKQFPIVARFGFVYKFRKPRRVSFFIE